MANALDGLTNKHNEKRLHLDKIRKEIQSSKELFDEKTNANIGYFIDLLDLNLNILELKIQQIGSCIDVQSMVFKKFHDLEQEYTAKLHELEKKIQANAKVIEPFIESKRTFNSLKKAMIWVTGTLAAVTGTLAAIGAFGAVWSETIAKWWHS